jgi:hypothetical protein
MDHHNNEWNDLDEVILLFVNVSFPNVGTEGKEGNGKEGEKSRRIRENL